MIYQFRTGNSVKGLDAQTVGDELEKIRLRNEGRLRTEDVVSEARDTGSPLHAAFTWKDKAAAHQFRLFEARHLIRSVVVVSSLGERPAPAFWNVVVPLKEDPERAEQYYQSAVVVAASPHEYEAALKTMLSKLMAAQFGLDQLREVAPKRAHSKIVRALKHVELAGQALA